MNHIIVGIAGRQGAGKSTIADYLAPPLPIKKAVYKNPWGYMLSVLFGYEYNLIEALLCGIEFTKIKHFLPKIVAVKFDIIHKALSKLHPQIETILKTNFIAPEVGRLSSTSDGLKSPSEVELKRPKTKQLSFAEPLKKICIAISGLPYEVLEGITEENRILREKPIPDFFKEMSGRELLEFVGTECFRSVDPNFWITVATISVKSSHNLGIMTVFSDVRFKNEEEMIHQLGGVLVVVARTERDLVLTQHDQSTHVSKWEFLTFINKKSDIIIINDGTIDDLINNVALIF